MGSAAPVCGSPRRIDARWKLTLEACDVLHLLENPTFREMNLVCVRCSEKAALSFSKTILDSFFSFLPPRYENREFDAPKGEIQPMRIGYARVSTRDQS